MIFSFLSALALLQVPVYIIWPGIMVFIVIVLLVACIVCVAIQDRQESSRPRSYFRTSDQDPWVPTQPKEPQVWEPSQHQIDVIVCSCEKWNAPKQTFCWNCNASLSSTQHQTFTFETAERCAVCSFWVYPGERVVLCPACHAQGHRAHMLEYLKAKGMCPICNQKLRPDDFLDSIPKITDSSEEEGSR